MQVMSLMPGLSGLVLLGLHLRMHIGFPVVPLLKGVWSLGVGGLVQVGQAWWAQGPQGAW